MSAPAPRSPTPVERESYRRPFFFIAFAILVSTGWLVYEESTIRRPWKDYQRGWFEIERARATANLAGERAWLAEGRVKGVVDGEEREVAVGERVRELEARLHVLEGPGGQAGELEVAQRSLEAAAGQQKEKETLLAFAKAEEDEAYYHFRDARHRGDATPDIEAKVTRARAKVLEATKACDAAAAAADAISDRIATLDAERQAAKKELADYLDGVSTAERAVKASSSRFSGAERLISSDGRIEQLWNPEIGLVDRCHTCHAAFDACGFTRPQEIVEALVEEPLPTEAVGKRYCLTRGEAERYAAAAAKIKDSWGSGEELTFEKVKDGLALEDEPLATAAKRLGLSTAAADALYRTHPRARSIFQLHPPERFGCTTCHYGEGPRTKGVGANYLAGESAPFDHGRRDHFWELQQLDTKTHQVEASCFNCHREDYELRFAERLTRGRKLVDHLGCNGCHPLGGLDPSRKAGPSLRRVAGKVDVPWLLAWIQAPRALRPRTSMPNLWPSALAADGKVDPSADRCDTFDYPRGSPFASAQYGRCVDVREEESAYIAAYLLARSAKDTFPPLPASASAVRGKQLFEGVGCAGCHNLGAWSRASLLPGSTSRDLAPNLSNIGDKVKAPGWFFAWVKDPREYWSETRMPSFRLSDAEAWDLAAFLATQTSSAAPALSERARGLLDAEGSAEKGRRLMAYYGCFGCHDVEGFEATPRIAADLTEFGSKVAAELDFGDVRELVANPGSQTWESWTRKKLSSPRAFRYERSALRMPQHDLNAEELDDLVIFLRSQNTVTKRWPSSIRSAPSKEALAISRGQRLVDEYNCTGCHEIDERGVDLDGDHVLDGGDILRFLAEDKEELFRAPPKLIREGAKVYPDWLFKFLKAPSKLRENYRVRMPTFPLGDREATDLVAYFAARAKAPYPFLERRREAMSRADRRTAEKLFGEAQCLSCHNLGDKAPVDPKNVSPNLRLAAERLQPEWLAAWLQNPQEQAPGVGMPNFFITVEDRPGALETPLTDLAGGDAHRQIELLRAFVVDLGAEPTRPPTTSSRP